MYTCSFTFLCTERNAKIIPCTKIPYFVHKSKHFGFAGDTVSLYNFPLFYSSLKCSPSLSKTQPESVKALFVFFKKSYFRHETPCLTCPAVDIRNIWQMINKQHAKNTLKSWTLELSLCERALCWGKHSEVQPSWEKTLSSGSQQHSHNKALSLLQGLIYLSKPISG